MEGASKKGVEKQKSPQEQKEITDNQHESLRVSLQLEARDFYLDTASEDSDAYKEASIALAVFTDRLLEASGSLSTMLNRNDALPESSPAKLSEEQIALYRQIQYEADSFAIAVPRQMQQLRMNQYEPEVQKRLQQLFSDIAKKDALLDWIEVTRSALLQGGKKNGEVIPPEDVAKLIPVADELWRIKNNLTVPVNLEVLLKELRNSAEPADQKLTKKIEKELNTAKALADLLRKDVGSDRIAQRFPGAEFVLDDTSISIGVWKRLLLDTKGVERIRNARTLEEDVRRYHENFVLQNELQSIRKDAESLKNKAIRGEDNVARWFDWMGMETVGDYAATTPAEIEHAHARIMKEIENSFQEISDLPESKKVVDLLLLLKQIQQGTDVDPKQVEQLLDSYGSLQQKSISFVGKLQRWQVLNAVDSQGNPAHGKPSMLGKITRVNDKTLVGYLRQHSPYGMFQKLSYRDDQTNQIVLVLDSKPFLEYTVGDQLKELGTGVLYGVPTYLALRTLIQRIPVLRGPLNRLLPAVMMEQIPYHAGRSLGARQAAEWAENKATDVLDSLRQNKETWTREQAQQASDELFTEIYRLLHTSHSNNDLRTPDTELALEAHLYANQLLVAIGYPPLHELGVPAVPDKVDESKSPVIQAYTKTKLQERQGSNVDKRQQLHELKVKLGIEKNKLQDPIDTLLRNSYPPNFDNISYSFRKDNIRTRVDQLEKAAHAPEFSKETFQKSLESLQKKVQAKTIHEAVNRTAGRIWLAWTRLDAAVAIETKRWPKYHYQFVLDNKIPLDKTYTPGRLVKGKPFTRAQVEKDMDTLLADLTPHEVMAIALYLEEHEPTNDEIITLWTDQKRPEGFLDSIFGEGQEKIDSTIDAYFGKKGQRSELGSKFLSDWVDTMGYKSFRDNQ